MKSSEAQQYMRLAIEEGRKAIPKSGDNPPVGCVLVKNGVVVAKGHTSNPGQPHAEAMAISELEMAGNDITAFVTLEPCSFHGRTPSCAQALIEAGITSVYVGMIDPDPRNNGQGIEMLKAAGVEVYTGVLESEVFAELEDYLGKAP